MQQKRRCNKNEIGSAKKTQYYKVSLSNFLFFDKHSLSKYKVANKKYQKCYE
jgi:hypothetical protein